MAVIPWKSGIQKVSPKFLANSGKSLKLVPYAATAVFMNALSKKLWLYSCKSLIFQVFIKWEGANQDKQYSNKLTVYDL